MGSLSEEVRTEVLCGHICDLEAENAKLRELVDALMGCGTRYHTMQGACPMFDADAEDFCKAASIARELGVEVSE